ncbi:hypothetical protein EON63_04185 [archaeon]|nr:MAG: hypothetical protein EON63_04185 [archaeon]
MDLLQHLYPRYYGTVYQQFVQHQPLDPADCSRDRVLTVWKALCLVYQQADPPTPTPLELAAQPKEGYVQSIEDATLQFWFDFDCSQYSLEAADDKYVLSYVFDALSYAKILFLRNVSEGQLEVLFGTHLVHTLQQTSAPPSLDRQVVTHVDMVSSVCGVEQVVVIQKDTQAREQLEGSFIVKSLQQILKINVVFLSSEEDQELAQL